MIYPQTFDLPNEEEAATLAQAIALLGGKQYEAALEVLVARHDALLAKPVLRMYDPREAA